MDIGAYLDHVERDLSTQAGVTEVDPARVTREQGNRAILRFRISFLDGSFLDFHERVDTEQSFPDRWRYSYQYMKEGAQVFRYDNSPHHPRVATHPHHKHEGPKGQDRILPSQLPSRNRLFREILNLLRPPEK